MRTKDGGGYFRWRTRKESEKRRKVEKRRLDEKEKKKDTDGLNQPLNHSGMRWQN
jgi:hypothetical protein